MVAGWIICVEEIPKSDNIYTQTIRLLLHVWLHQLYFCVFINDHFIWILFYFNYQKRKKNIEAKTKYQVAITCCCFPVFAKLFVFSHDDDDDADDIVDNTDDCHPTHGSNLSKLWILTPDLNARAWR